MFGVQQSCRPAVSCVTKLMNLNCSHVGREGRWFLYNIHRSTTTSTYTEPEYDMVIVGGGIVGMATARELSMQHPKLKFAVVEKESTLAAHQSGHNSGVIHAGIYYVPGTLKAKLCVQGLDYVYKYCDEKNIPYKKVGKLIVATTPLEVERLGTLYERGMKNGAKDLQMIDGNKIKEIEPYCKGLKAVWSPHTGIVDFRLITEEYGKDFKKMKGKIHLNFQVNGFNVTAESQESGGEGNIYPVRITSSTGGVVRCKYVLTCCGLYSDRVAEMSGCSSEPRIIPFRGEYMMLKPEKTYLVKGNIYPVPDPRFPFLGVHFTPRMDGNIWLGPNAILAASREGYKYTDINISELADALKFPGFQKLAIKFLGFGAGEVVRSLFPKLALTSLQRFIPEVTEKDIIRGPSGVRAQAMDRKGTLVDDFVFDQGTGELGKRILHCRNAPSPGATSSMAIAKMMADKVAKQFSL